jgi:predicted esterase
VVLRPGTLYAAVVRRELGGPGDELGTPMDLEIVKWTSPRADAREERARRLHAGAFDYLTSLGVPRDRIASIALFRTHAPHRVTARLVDVIAHLPPDRAPRVLDAAWVDEDAGYATIEGTYCTPNFQADLQHAPFLADDGGRFVLDPSGAPRVIDVPAESPYHSAECGGLMRARFVLTVPKARPMPASGWPLLVSAHGTGGDARSFVGRDDFAGWAASQGVAVISTDQPLHGGRGRAPRPGSREPFRISIAGIPIKLTDDPRGNEVAFYNPVHPAAARDNLRQAAADLMVLARLFPATDLARFLPPGRPAPRLDPARVLAAGHSQGAQSVAAAGAVDPILRGVILSGCGGDARLGVLRRRDLPIVPAFAMLLGLEPGELDELHPLMTLLQTLADPIDPASYARLYWEPLSGRRPQMVLHYEGVSDTFTPPVTAETLAVALKATPIDELVRPVPGLGAPASWSELLRRGEAPRAFVQLASTRGEDGHFVLFHEPGAPELLRTFLRAAVGRR